MAMQGVPYQISVCRYYGDGTEWSDSNSNGPNIEFDGFGLFLWALDEYVAASGDTSLITTYWASTIKPKVADVLVHSAGPERAHLRRLLDLGGALGRPAAALHVHDGRGSQRPVLRVARRDAGGRHRELHHVPDAGSDGARRAHPFAARPRRRARAEHRGDRLGDRVARCIRDRGDQLGAHRPHWPDRAGHDERDEDEPARRRRRGLHARPDGGLVRLAGVGLRRPALGARASLSAGAERSARTSSRGTRSRAPTTSARSRSCTAPRPATTRARRRWWASARALTSSRWPSAVRR